jgi:glycosyltransferase involved in cell wall biosynthesis
MNIAYILHSTEANGGATRAFLNMLDGVMPFGVKPFVVVPGKEGVYSELQKRQIPTLVVTYRSSTYPYFHTMQQRLLFFARLAARIIANYKATAVLTTWLREKNIDIVHSNTGIVRIGFDAAQRVGIPHVYHIREFADLIGYHYFPVQASFMRQLHSNNSYNICITKAIQHHYHQDDNDRQSRVIYDGVFPKMATMPSGINKNYFLFAGRIQPAKGLRELLEAYLSYFSKNDHPLHLKVAGSNGDDAYYESQLKFIKDNGLTDHVELLGSRDDIAALMREARALIVSSPFEGFGLCMPEAMQQGCLVIARNTTGTKEQLDNALEMTGREIALRYETVNQLTGLLSEVASHPVSFYGDYTESAFKVVNQLYTKEVNAKRVYEFYNDIQKCPFNRLL